MQQIQKRIVKFNSKKQLALGVILLYIIMSFFSLSVESKIPTYITFVIALFIFAISLSGKFNAIKLAIALLLFFSLLSMTLFSNRNNEPVAIMANSFFFLVSCSICNIIYKFDLSRKVAVGLFIISHGYFLLFCLYQYHVDGFIDENTFNQMFYLSSRNIVSAILLTITIFFFSVFYVRDNKIFVSILIMDFICSLLLYGRSGILVSFCLLLLGIYLKYVKIKTVNSLIYTFTFSFILIVIIAINVNFLISLYFDLINKTNLQSGLDTPRLMMWYDYVTNFNLNVLFGGTTFDFSPLITSFEGNPHNSYIMFQGRFGIVGFIFLFGILGLWLRTIFKHPVIGGLLFLVLMRMFLDTYALFSYFDFIWMYMLIFLSIDSFRYKNETLNIDNHSSI